ncbi:phosphatase PAP2 family protein [Halobacteria archaeon AArc-curdl1]|uniref:Phosphatase PAP2 family protein n=1 Tax=Natronosalvus hydrolyticus TaxID=2979988 RepID=A0AAP2ZAA1_9EURY|nr:phosphatase PAP2 family protein [Halobacteria archaeon AArc-curdl1]
MLFDPATVEAVRDIAPLWLVALLTVLSFLGSTFYQVPVLLTIYWVSARERAATWLGIVLGSYAFRSLLKHLNDIERPPVDPPIDPAAFPALVRPIYAHPAEIATTSFPSGHTLSATVLWGLLVVDTEIATRRTRFAVAGSVIFTVGLSRIVLGAHYIEDVVAGFLFGILFLGVALWLRNRSPTPVGATFGLAGLISLVVVSFTESTTGSVLLGVSIGTLLVWHGRSLLERQASRQLGAGGVFVLAVAVFSSVILELLLAGFLLGILAFWVPRQPRVRTTVTKLPFWRRLERR